MRLSVVLGFAACFLLPFQSQAAWDIFQSYVILDSGSGDQFLAGGINADGATAFAGTDLGDFTAADALTLNGGELKTYKNASSNVCGGTLNYRVYASGDTPGAFTALALPFNANLSGSDQKWAATGQAIDLLNALTPGDYVLELYWEADGNENNSSGCGETKYDSDSGNNYTATFSVVVPGCTDAAYVEYDAAATSDDGTCATLHNVLNSSSGVGYADIQTAIDAAAAGDAITLAATAFSPTGQITVNKALSLTGAGSGSTTINGGGAGYAIAVTADNVHLEGFTLNGAASYGIKVSNSTTSVVQDFSMTDVATDGTTRTGIDLNGVDGATLTNISGLNATGGFGLAIASSADITVNGLTTSGNAWGDAAIFPAGTAYQIAGYEAPTDITFEGVLSLSSGTGALSVQDGALASGGTWTGSIANDASDNADITVPADYDGTVNATRNDGLSFHTVSPGAVAEGIAGSLTSATTPFSYSDISFQNLTSDEWAVFGDLTIQDAIDAASEGDFIEVDAGTYNEDLNIDKGVTLYGPNWGTAPNESRVAEAILAGEHTLSSTGTTTLDGFQFLNDDAGSVTTSLTITNAGNHLIVNNRFVSTIAGGNTGGTHDKGIYINSLASGSLTIALNSFSGDGSFSDGDRYSTAPWGRGIWMNGGGDNITISENTFTNCRTGINLEAYDDNAHFIEDNTFSDCGSGMSLGIPTATAISSITGNRFQDVDTDLNLRNLIQAVEWDLANTDNLAVAGNSTYYSDLGYIPGNSAGDIDDPNGNMVFLSGDGADRLTLGGDDNTITGDNAGAANDYIDGGGGTDLVNYSDNEADVTLTADGDAVIIATPTAGTDTLVNIEFIVLADATLEMPIGCTDSDYIEYDASANTDDGSCSTLIVEGCMDPDYTEYDASANTDDGSCTTPVVEGCTDSDYIEYDASANTDDGSCTTLVVEGCMDPDYTEYDASANTDDGSCTTLVDPCAGALVLGSIDATASSDINTADGSATLTITTGTPTSLTLTGINGAGDYTFAQPGAIDGIAAGYYEVTAVDADGCNSDTLKLVMSYSLCCDCGVSDADSDGICDDEDNCTDKSAANYNDPANVTCSFPGCTNPAAANYDPDANTDDGSCIIYGCTDPAYQQYDAAANTDDGSCSTLNVEGCMDSAAANYDPSANVDDGSCLYPGCMDPAYQEYDASANTDDGSCSTLIVEGCMDSAAANYDPAANVDDGSCLYPGCMDPAYQEYDASANTDDGSCSTLIVEGCMDSAAANYDPAANVDDGSCLYPGCMDPAYQEYDATANTDDGSCSTLIVEGCMDSAAANYDPAANVDDGSCLYPGCTDSNADNYNAAANTDDGSCIVTGCMDSAFEEYNPDANTDDGSCSTPAYCSPVDMDGVTYDVVEIDDQCWFTFNLRSSVYADGTPIPYVGWEPSGPGGVLSEGTAGDIEWANDTEGGQCVNLHNNVSSDGSWYSSTNPDFSCDNYEDTNLPQFCCTMCAYGRLYNHHAVTHPSGLCPTDWHVPTDADWTQLTDYVASQGHAGNEGTALKGTDDAHWHNGDQIATDAFGLAITGQSYRKEDGAFSLNGAQFGFYWSSTPDGNGNGWVRLFRWNSPIIVRIPQAENKGLYVRCIKDAQD